MELFDVTETNEVFTGDPVPDEKDNGAEQTGTENGENPEKATDSAVSGEETEKSGEEDNCDAALSNDLPESAAQVDDGKLDAVIAAAGLICGRLEALETLFNNRIMHTDYEEKIVDQMHAELQKYKEGLYAQLVRPILVDVIGIRDSIMRMAATFLEKPEGERDIPNDTFAGYAYDLQDILEKNGVEIYRTGAGEAFVPIRQRVVKKLPTDDESLHGKVAASLTCGYSYDGRVISAEKVAVYFYQKPDPTTENNTENKSNSEVIENG